MSFGGGIKFFEKSKSLEVDGSTIVASSGDASSSNALNRDIFRVWRSVGTDDTTTETITITFPSSTTFDRILCINVNWLDFTIEFDSGGFTDFTSVIGLDGAPPGPGITETAFADDTAYYEFDSVTTTIVKIQVLKTQVVDDEKFLSQFIATTELGTLVGFPTVDSVIPSRNSRVSTVTSGRTNVVKSLQTFSFQVNFETFPGSFSSDWNLIFDIYDRSDPILVWLCGGNRGSTKFSFEIPGYRLIDAIPMQITNAPELSYLNNVLIGPINAPFSFAEVVQ